MGRSRMSARSILFLVAITAGINIASHKTVSAELWSVSIRPQPVLQNERVVGFEMKIRAGGIVSIPSLPMGWNISVDNDASWNTKIVGAVTVGAAALNVSFFSDFIVVRQHEFRGTKFDADMVIVVTEDFETNRRIRFGLKDLILRKR